MKNSIIALIFYLVNKAVFGNIRLTIKTVPLLCSMFFLFSFTSCSSSKSAKFDEITQSHLRIAVVPFQSKLRLSPKQQPTFTDAEIQAIELAQGESVQDAVESCLISRNLNVTIQSSGSTNAKLRAAGIDFSNMDDQDYSNLAKILDVDAVVGGYIETEKPMDELVATGINIVKNIESTLLGTSFGSSVSTVTNRGLCRITVFEGEKGDRIWSYSKDVEMGVGSTTQDVVNNLMRRGARRFPYRS